jgi:hypothetical protein
MPLFRRADRSYMTKQTIFHSRYLESLIRRGWTFLDVRHGWTVRCIADDDIVTAPNAERLIEACDAHDRACHLPR